MTFAVTRQLHAAEAAEAAEAVIAQAIGAPRTAFLS